MTKKLMTKRNGTFIADALISLVIVALIIIPVAGLITFAYSAVVDSAAISREYNEFCDGVDENILAHMLDPTLPISGVAPFAIVISGDISADVVAIPGVLEIGATRRVPVRVHMIRQR